MHSSDGNLDPIDNSMTHEMHGDASSKQAALCTRTIPMDTMRVHSIALLSFELDFQVPGIIQATVL